MSASKEKKDPQKRAARDEKRRQEEAASRRTMALYTTIGVVVLAAAVALMVWTSGILQRSLTALNVDGTKYTSVDLQYYYSTMYSQTLNSALNTLGMYPFDTGVSLKKQVYDQETGQSWHDYLLEQAKDSLAATTALANKAGAEGYTLSEEGQQQLDSYIAQLDSAWLGYGSYTSRDAFIRASYGPYMSYDRLVGLLRQEALASDYASAQLEQIDHGEEDYQSYYQENADRLDTFDYSIFTLQARVDTTDAEGNPVEMTEAERAELLEQRKAEQLAKAQQLQARLDAGADVETVAGEFEEELYSSGLHRQNTGSSVTGATYAEWLLEAGRRAGDTTITEYDGGSTVYSYYVTQFHGRERDDSNTADVRHILVAAEQDAGVDQPTQAQYDAAYDKAEELLAQWKAGEATEDSFAALAAENSADTGSASNGGLISNISSRSTYVDTFMDWALSTGRRPGDTGLVQNTGSTTKGWHIMYYVAQGEPIWRQTAENALAQEDYEQLQEQALQGVSVTGGMGANFVS